MISRFEYQLLEKSEKFYLAVEILECFKNRVPPDIVLFQRLYGYNKAETIYNIIKNYFFINPLSKYEIRKHDYEAPAEIYNARKELEEDKNYQNVHSTLLRGEIPGLNDLELLYGQYSKYIQIIFEKYNLLKLKRKCEVPAASHLNRVGGVAVKLNFNLKGCFEYGAVAAIHDAIEDLYPLVKDKSGKHYDFGRYKEFLDIYIPQNLQSNLKILTNHYNLIIAFVKRYLRENDKAINKKNINDALKHLMDKNYDEIGIYISQMYDILVEDDFDNEKDIIEYIKSKSYNSLYLRGIMNSSMAESNFRLFEIKGVDLSDNSHGKEALSLDGRIRNINKIINWATLGYAMKSTWMPLNNHIRECMEDSFVAAEMIIIRDLMQPQSGMDFMMAALISFNKLDKAFYIGI